MPPEIVPEEQYERLKKEWIDGTIAPLIGHRVRRGISRAEMARLMGCSEATVRKIETGNDLWLSQYVDYALALGFAPVGVAVDSIPQSAGQEGDR